MKGLILIWGVVLASLMTVTVAPVLANDVSILVDLDASAGELPEGLAVDEQGNVYFGLAPRAEIRRMTPGGEVSTFAQLPSPPENAFGVTGLAFDQAGDLYAAMVSFVPETHGIWRVSADGSTVERFAALDTAGLPNALDFDSQGNLYVSDTTGGGVWKIDQQGNVSTWKNDPLLVGQIPPGPVGLSIGANGIALDEDERNLYVAVTDFGRIVRIPVNDDGSAGTAEVFVESDALLGVDGITFDSHGNLYAAINLQDSIAVISPDGFILPVAQGSPIQNPANIEFGVGEHADTLYIANYAILRVFGLVPGTPEPALLSIVIEEAPALH